MYEGKVSTVIDEVVAELERATGLYSSMPGPHEGFVILQDRMGELWEEVREQERNKAAMSDEAIQVAAMAIRFILDCCVEEEEEEE